MDKVKQLLGGGGGGDGSSAPSAAEPSAAELAELRTAYADAGQGHVLAFYDSLAPAERGALARQLAGFDAARISSIARRALAGPEAAASNSAPDRLEPLPASATASLVDAKADQVASWRAAGLRLIAQGTVAVVLMAGGQGTRLGSSDPKGCFDIGLPSRKSLFRIQAERISKIQELAAASAGPAASTGVVPWYVMTSGPTRGPTERFFRDHDYFGLDAAHVVFFEQGVLPCLSPDGKLLLESRSAVAVAPDGNGGLYQALVVSGALDDMRKRGIQHVHAYCVDNCLVKVAEPVFLGFATGLNVDVATKVVRKRSATESVGLILSRNGKPDVVEYSEMDEATAAAEDPLQPGLLKFRAANIVNHYYSFRFLDTIPQWAHKLPHHVAHKKIPAADPQTGETVKPDAPNGVKLEQFVFDVFPMLPLDKFACMEVRRDDEFSPLKNARGKGEDDPDTSKRDVMAQGQRWAAQAGAIVVADGGVEISPLISYDGEGLDRLKGTTITAPAVLEREKAE